MIQFEAGGLNDDQLANHQRFLRDYERYCQVLFRVATRRLGHRFQLAEECVQETFVRYMESLNRGVSIASVGPWLFGILKNVLAETIRRESKQSHTGKLTSLVESSAPDPLSQMLDEELQTELNRAIEHLPPQQREVLLHDLARVRIGISSPTKQTTIRTPIGTVKSRRHRAVQKLRTIFTDSD